ncbi:MAG: hypothetical protein ACYC1F_11915 [Gallionellaceae bacterium]
MRIQDEEILKRLECLFPIRARLVARHSGDKGRFELTDREDREVDIDGVSALRIIVVLRRNNYLEAFEETNAFDGEIVFSKPAVCPVRTKREPHPLDDSPFVLNFF